MADPPPSTSADPGVVVAQDNDTEAEGSTTGDVEHPEAPPGGAHPTDAQREEQEEAAHHRHEERERLLEALRDQTACEPGSATTPQSYNTTVPFSSCALTMGNSVGGPGASLTTQGQVLIDAVSTVGLQAAGPLMGETNAGMALLSTAGTKFHSQAGVEIYAGGGSGPGGCGSGQPAAPAAAMDPGKFGMVAARAAAMVVSATQLVNDPVGAVVSTVGSAGGLIGSIGGSDITEKASGNIKMIAASKITGCAPYGIKFRCVNKFGVNAALTVDMSTILWSAFAILKFEIKTFGWIKTFSGKWDMAASTTYDVKKTAKAEVVSVDTTVTAPHIRMECTTFTVTKDTVIKDTLDVVGKTKFEDTLHVEQAALIKGELKVAGKGEIKNKLTVEEPVKIEKDVEAVVEWINNGEVIIKTGAEIG